MTLAERKEQHRERLHRWWKYNILCNSCEDVGTIYWEDPNSPRSGYEDCTDCPECAHCKRRLSCESEPHWIIYLPHLDAMPLGWCSEDCLERYCDATPRTAYCLKTNWHEYHYGPEGSDLTIAEWAGIACERELRTARALDWVIINILRSKYDACKAMLAERGEG